MTKPSVRALAKLGAFKKFFDDWEQGQRSSDKNGGSGQMTEP